MSSFKRSAVVAVSAAAAVLLPATASAQTAEIPAEGWKYSAAWDVVQDDYTAEAQAATEATLGASFQDWTFTTTLEGTRLQNYYLDDENETPVQRKFRADFAVPETEEALLAELYLPGGITEGVQDLSAGGPVDLHYLLHCVATDTECASEELADGTLLAWTTDGTYVEAAAFFPDGSVGSVWWGEDYFNGTPDGAIEVTTEEVAKLATLLDTDPVWAALEAEA
ncbi:hypothetical protein LO763_18200 [Glycomyces sp. A-F 0318]|uniref:hypothetical protein n=1 Tax=Glycomyces amatae TaxID=2881355 RepID=UPI001E3E22DD|nr:hypothetical protein [Glycomyces amatae]MCD0445547.1 hypothetical protein [Glycomyces amatae]